MGFDLIDYQKLAAATAPLIASAIKQSNDDIVNNIIPALGVQLQAGIKTAGAELNTDAAAAIDKLHEVVDGLPARIETALKNTIDHFIEQVKTLEPKVGF